jgi:hypothetical protein
MVKNIIHKGNKVYAVGNTYSNPRDRKAISLFDMTTHEPYCVATVNLPELSINDDEVFIKDYSENEGIMQSLIDSSIIKENPVSEFNYNFVKIYKFKLTDLALNKLWQKDIHQ